MYCDLSGKRGKLPFADTPPELRYRHLGTWRYAVSGPSPGPQAGGQHRSARQRWRSSWMCWCLITSLIGSELCRAPPKKGFGGASGRLPSWEVLRLIVSDDRAVNSHKVEREQWVISWTAINRDLVQLLWPTTSGQGKTSWLAPWIIDAYSSIL
jgi:hypothetical protein